MLLAIYIDSEDNNIRYFNKIKFVNKGIELINSPSILKDKTVISSVPTYLENKESPIICYKYNKPIQSTPTGVYLLDFFCLVFSFIYC